MRIVICTAALLLALALPALAQQQQQAPFAQGEHPFFQQWDKDGDGKLTRDEYLEAFRQRFDQEDANGDGYLTPEESLQARQQFRRGPGAMGGKGGMMGGGMMGGQQQ